MPPRDINFPQPAGATLNIEATIGDADPAEHETTPFTVAVENTGAAAVFPISVGCDLLPGPPGVRDPGISLFGPTAAAPVPISAPVGPPLPLGPGEVRRRHWVIYNDPTVAGAAGAHPPFTIVITVTDPLNPGGAAHNFTCPA